VLNYKKINHLEEVKYCKICAQKLGKKPNFDLYKLAHEMGDDGVITKCAGCNLIGLSIIQDQLYLVVREKSALLGLAFNKIELHDLLYVS
jgi:hypothetical protein